MSSSTAGLLDGSQRPGVYRVLDRADQVATALRTAGWATAVIGPTTDRADFYHELARALALPDYFGANLDALWDVLTELSHPTALVLTGWTTLATTRPDDWSRILAVLSERTESPPAFAVVLA